MTDGSIPARAGEPPEPCCIRKLDRVYPRACGGTPLDQPGRRGRLGLSPRVRGNRNHVDNEPAHIRSIPARAGEPGDLASPAPTNRVYPRACGGTTCRGAVLCAGVGLSPRVRGNPAQHRGPPPLVRSIPARAGEPRPGSRRLRRPGVYPRACGGTRARLGEIIFFMGLSPRVRGNLPRPLRHAGRVGSIPARAGEPATPNLTHPIGPVYPRACGGTAEHGGPDDAG